MVSKLRSAFAPMADNAERKASVRRMADIPCGAA